MSTKCTDFNQISWNLPYHELYSEPPDFSIGPFIFLTTLSSTRLSQCLSFQVTISGVFRGVGKQYLAAIINFLCYNVLGLSVVVPLALKADLGTIGLWSGLAIGNVIQVQ